MSNPKIQVAVPEQLARKIESRHELRHDVGPLSRLCITDLWTWQSVLDAELRQHEWSLDDLAVIADALNGAIPDVAVPRTLGAAFQAVWDSMDAAGRDRVRPQLDRLGGLGPAADMALCDAVAAWLAAGSEHSVDGWAAHGVRVRP